ncbi:MAG: lysylphosphatidylglycerol synthase transmembrane domain-containing protein [Phycisphaerales bacterium]|nr:lysylphosphatidylglycerol synthase transmembrane domain-containing protein [Phycisphaerales bacterium]
MKRHLFTAARLSLVVVGITFIAFLVDWRSTLLIPAGEPGVDGVVSPTATELRVTDFTPEDQDRVRITTGDGRAAVVPSAWVRPGLLRVFRDADWGWLVIGFGLVGCIYPLQTTRWWILMRCRGIPATWVRTLRLVMVGAFCNFFLPGTEGGDVVKAWGAAKGSGRRLDAVMSVIFDRVTGLAGLVLLAAAAGLFAAETGIARDIGRWSGWLAVAALSAVVVGFTAIHRGWLRIPPSIDRLGRGVPTRILDAAHAYGSHPAAVASATSISVIVQVLLASAAGCCGWAIGIHHDLPAVLVAMPIIFIAAAIPLTWQGAGVMEVVGIGLLAGVGLASVNQIVAMLLLYRCLELAWGLTGSILMLRGDIEIHPQTLEDNVRDPLKKDSIDP